MRHYRSHTLPGRLLVAYSFVLLPVAFGIMVPTGKLTPIQPAEPSPQPINVPSLNKQPAPVSEYTNENPEPVPLHPSYVPIRPDYIQYLKPTTIVYIPVKIKNPASWYNPITNEINSSEKLQKYVELKTYTKVPLKLLRKYENLPPHLQKKYYHYYLNSATQNVAQS